MEDLNQYSAPLLAIAGFVLQFVVRQFSKIPETVYYGLAIGLCSAVWLLVTESQGEVSVRLQIIQYLLWMSANLTSLFGGTFLASGAAKAAEKAGVANSVMVPVTNSK